MRRDVPAAAVRRRQVRVVSNQGEVESVTPDQRVVEVLQRAVGGAAAERDVRALTELTRDELTAAINRLRAAGTVKVRTARMGAVAGFSLRPVAFGPDRRSSRVGFLRIGARSPESAPRAASGVSLEQVDA